MVPSLNLSNVCSGLTHVTGNFRVIDCCTSGQTDRRESRGSESRDPAVVLQISRPFNW